MKRILFIGFTLTLIITTQSTAQIFSTQQSLSTYKSKYQSSIEICIDKTSKLYSIRCIHQLSKHEFDARYLVETLSSGIIIENDSIIILHDLQALYNSKIKVVDTVLKVIEGFEDFKNLLFISYDTMSWNINTSLSIHKSENLNQNLKKKSHSDSLLFSIASDKYAINNKNFQFNIGEYRQDWVSITFTGNEYAYHFKEYLLTKGKWRRLGDYIILDDLTLKSNFFLELIDDNELTTKTFPYFNDNLIIRLQ